MRAFSTQTTVRIVALGALALVIALSRLHTYHEPLEVDASAYAVIAHELLAGRALYSDMWDHKPPAIYASFALAEWAAGYGPHTIYLIGVVLAVITLLGAYAAGAAGGGAIAGLWAAVFWAVISGDLWLQANQPNSEAFINACVIWAFALLVRAEPGSSTWRQWIVIGGLFALASLYKQVIAAPAGLVLALHVMSAPPEARRRALAQAGTVAAAGVAAWAAVLVYFAVTGRFGSFYDAVFVYNRWGAGNPVVNAVWGFKPPLLFSKHLASALPLAVLAGVGVIVGLCRAPQRRWRLLLAWAVGSHVAVSLPAPFVPHYYQLWLPPLVVGAGWAVSLAGQLADQLAGARRVFVSTAVAGTALVVLLTYQAPLYATPPDDWSKIKYGPIFVAEREMAGEINRLLEPDERFFEWGSEIGLYFVSGRRPVCGPCFFWPLTVGPVARRLQERLLADLERTQPELLIIAKWTVLHNGPPQRAVLEWFEPRYRPIPGGRERGPYFLVFVRQGGKLEQRLERVAVR